MEDVRLNFDDLLDNVESPQEPNEDEDLQNPEELQEPEELEEPESPEESEESEESEELREPVLRVRYKPAQAKLMADFFKKNNIQFEFIKTDF